MAAGSSQVSQSVKKELRVLIGHIVVSGRWRKTELVATLQRSVQVQYEDSLGVVDFHPASQVGVIYVSEAEVVGDTGYKRKCATLRRANKVRGVVLVERTAASEQYFEGIQTVCGLEMGLAVIPVTSTQHAADLLVQMVSVEGKPDSNPFGFKRCPGPAPNLDDAILSTVQTIPGVGTIKAKQLLDKFKSIHGISSANQKELSQVLGQASAQDTWQFFHGSTR